MTIGVVHNGAQAPKFTKPSTSRYAAPSLTDRSSVSAAGTGSGGGGAIRLSGEHVSVSQDTEVLGATTGTGAGSSLHVDAESLSLTESGRLRSQARSSGPGGLVEIVVDELSLASGGRILSEATGSGPGGPIRSPRPRSTPARRVQRDGNGDRQHHRRARSRGGNLFISADTISFTTARRSSPESGSGNTGAVRAADDRAERHRARSGRPDRHATAHL
jgi:hypothetical protein